MKRILGIAIAGLLSACAVAEEPEPALETVEPDGDIEELSIDQVRQRAQFADDTVMNLVDFAANPVLALTADFNPVTVNVIYVSTKTTDTGSVLGNAYLRATIELTADQTKLHTVALGHVAFSGGYGSIVLDSSGDGSFDVFQTHVISPEGGTQSVGGSVFTGGSYRIPYLASSSKMVLAITNQTDFPFGVEIFQIASTNFKTITLPAFSTYKFDSSAYAWNLGNKVNSVQLFTTSGGVVAVSGYTIKGTTKYRVVPVKAAPYF